MKPEMKPSSSSEMIKSAMEVKENTTNTAAERAGSEGVPWLPRKSQLSTPCPSPGSIPTPQGGLTTEKGVLEVVPST